MKADIGERISRGRFIKVSPAAPPTPPPGIHHAGIGRDCGPQNVLSTGPTNYLNKSPGWGPLNLGLAWMERGLSLASEWSGICPQPIRPHGPHRQRCGSCHGGFLCPGGRTICSSRAHQCPGLFTSGRSCGPSVVRPIMARKRLFSGSRCTR